MRRSRILITGLALALALVTTARAAEVKITVPQAAVANAVAMCEELRKIMSVDPADWSNEACATEFFRRGLRRFTRQAHQREARPARAAAQRQMRAEFDAAFPIPVVPTTCGDGTVQKDHRESCDDGNRIAGDGCSTRCQIEPSP